MTNDGKDLEDLVAFVEKSFSPDLDVKVNQRVFDKGKQIAEFDVEVKGKLGTTKIAWLIQCRDRPSEGPSPADWIEQLVGRRDRFGFNKVTAVSTQGFASGAKDYAEEEGIELREVKSLAPESFNWIELNHMELHRTTYDCEHATFNLSPDEPKEKQEALQAIIKKMNGNDAILKSIKTGEKVSPKQAFLNTATQYPKLTDNLKPDEEPRKLKIKARYPEDDYFVIETSLGEIRIREIEFIGSAKLEVDKIPAAAIQYNNTSTGEVIAEIAAFTFTTQDAKMSLEMHKIPGAEFMQVVLRNKGK